MSETPSTIDALLQEDREFPPPVDFSKNAVANDPGIYDRASKDPEAFWESMANELYWFKRWEKVLQWDPPSAQWFSGGKLNVSYNCLDRHLNGPRRNKAALIWEGEPGDWKVYTYWDLHREVCRFANALKDQGVKKGDRISIYLPMIPVLDCIYQFPFSRCQ